MCIVVAVASYKYFQCF